MKERSKGYDNSLGILRGEMKGIRRNIKGKIEEGRKKIIIGDFNIRIGKKDKKRKGKQEVKK